MPDTVTLPTRPEWRQAAHYAGHRYVWTWLREVVEEFLETGPGRFFPILPLDWHRSTFKAIRTHDGKTYGPHEVRGLVARCFGIYRGRDVIRADPKHDHAFTLSHIPTGRRLATLERVRSCKRLAEALAPLRMNWHAIDPERVAGTDAAKVAALVKEYETAAFPIRPVYTAGVGGRPR
ncbi:MAG TPA: hypothetical protein VH988_19100 [Thermoanaerobaculia bacterium]|jgi:hypothetical protein|nr:hypothetical protein [Thermoanaerobaculia bacterium]